MRLRIPHPSPRPGMRTGQRRGSGWNPGLWVSAPSPPPCTHKPGTQDGSHPRCRGLWPTGPFPPVEVRTRGRLCSCAQPVFLAQGSPPAFPGRRGSPAPRGGMKNLGCDSGSQISSVLRQSCDTTGFLGVAPQPGPQAEAAAPVGAPGPMGSFPQRAGGWGGNRVIKTHFPALFLVDEITRAGFFLLIWFDLLGGEAFKT